MLLNNKSWIDLKSILAFRLYNIIIFKFLNDKITFSACQRVIMVCKSSHKGTNGQEVKADAV